MSLEETKTLIARQVAIFDGLVWDRIPPKVRDRYISLAATIVATVERRHGSLT